MRKILLLMILFTVMTSAQVFNPYGATYRSSGVLYRYGGVESVFAVELNGTDEYMSNSSPVNLDLNDTNRVVLAIDNDFELSSQYASDFSAGIDSWNDVYNVTLAGNIDVYGKTDVLSIESDGSNGRVQSKGIANMLPIGETGIISFDYYMPSSNTATGLSVFAGNTWSLYGLATTQDAWTHFTGTGIGAIANATYLQIAFDDGAAGDTIYIKNVDVSKFPSYTATGNHSFDSTSVDPLTGSYSGLIVLEGIDLIINGNFTSWTDDNPNSWDIEEVGDATSNVTENPGGECQIISDGVYVSIKQVIYTPGLLYSYSVDVTAVGSGDVEMIGNQIHATLGTASGTGTFTGTFIPNATGVTFRRKAACDVTLDNIVIKQVGGDADNNYASLPAVDFTALEDGKKYTFQMQAKAIEVDTDLTVQIGGQSKTFIAVDNSATETLVWNFEATASEVGQPIQLFSSQPDEIRIDEVDLSEAYDMTVLAWVNSDDDGVVEGVTGWYPELNHFDTYLHGALDEYRVRVGDATAITASVDISALWGTWMLVSAQIDRTGNIIAGVNGSTFGTPLSIADEGRISDLGSFQLGRYSDAAFVDGFLGEVQIIRGQILTADEILAAYNLGIKGKHFLETGNEVGWWKFAGSDNTVFLSDETGDNNLTGVNVTQSDDQVKLKNYGN